MKNPPPKSSPPMSGKRLALAAKTGKSPSSLDALPAHIVANVKLERRSEILPSQMWNDSYPDEGKEARIISALDRVANFRAVGPAEEMLSTMLVNTNEAYIDCQRRAMMHVNNPHIFSVHMAHSERLSKLFLLQLAALDKHRSRGKQQVRVEHVYVGSGGQAIVGQLAIHSGKTKAPDGASADDDHSAS